MTIIRTYYDLKRILIALSLLLLSVILHAQNQPDSTTPPDEVTVEDTVMNQQVDNTQTDYFIKKELQSTGGGPGSLRLRKLPDSIIKRMSQDKDFWYVNYQFEKQKQEDNEQGSRLKKKSRFADQPFVQTLLWLLIIAGFVAFVIIYLSNSNAGLFRRKNKIIGTEEEQELATENIFEINYQRAIEKATREGNYRLAVRLMFLHTLTILSNQKIIDYKQDRTNFDYLLQLRSGNYYADFFRLTRNYEYSWYGHFDIDPEKFRVIKNEFENFDNRLK